jgi:hypothetical protein
VTEVKNVQPPAAAYELNPSSPMDAEKRALWINWYEFPKEDPAWPEIYTYTNYLSYDPGDVVEFHVSTTSQSYSIEIVRDGCNPASVYRSGHLAGRFHKTPKDAYKTGCHWPSGHSWRVPAGTPSGFYKVISRCPGRKGTTFTQHHWFVVRPIPTTQSGKLLMVLPTATWTAYNDWGGANHYEGVDGPEGNNCSPTLCLQRPWTRGMVWLPAGAPRIGTVPKPAPGDVPRYQTKEWAFANGFGRYCAAAGYAQYDRHFVQWAEREGIPFDMITQTDLQFRPEILNAYQCVTIVGHDEYWSRAMRENLDGFVERGGRLARFGGNFLWQIRLESEGRRQVCYKYRARAEDPVRLTPDRNMLTSAWEDRQVGWPGATTVGVNALRGMYVGFGGFAPRTAAGFTVYRPAHWAFAGTDLYYGDLFGAEARVFAYEVDGLDYTFRNGLPYPTGHDGAPEGIEILAMNVATLGEEAHGAEGADYFILDADLDFKTLVIEDEVTPATKDKHRYGSGMIVHMRKGRGEVFTAGSCEWVMGLKLGDSFTEQITRNVLSKFTE